VKGVNNFTKVASLHQNSTGPTSPINEFDGNVHSDGKRYFPDGSQVKGVNNFTKVAKPENNALRLTQIPKIRSFA
jgi:hypothetical protein